MPADRGRRCSGNYRRTAESHRVLENWQVSSPLLAHPSENYMQPYKKSTCLIYIELKEKYYIKYKKNCSAT